MIDDRPYSAGPGQHWPTLCMVLPILGQLWAKLDQDWSKLRPRLDNHSIDVEQLRPNLLQSRQPRAEVWLKLTNVARFRASDQHDLGQKSSRDWPVSPDLDQHRVSDQHWSNPQATSISLGQTRAKFGATWAGVRFGRTLGSGPIWPNLGQIWPKLVKLGQRQIQPTWLSSHQFRRACMQPV